ncbi:stressosome-associated protein Prli42 [Thalassobacillus sp. C254]|uniref:stressosome-associated protein Prli42 n=1 Tax=Thalassobacillus sp. C254 TaxID=1225341 RepID=UPI0006CFC916
MPRKFQKVIIYIMIITLVVGSLLTGAATFYKRIITRTEASASVLFYFPPHFILFFTHFDFFIK